MEVEIGKAFDAISILNMKVRSRDWKAFDAINTLNFFPSIEWVFDTILSGNSFLT